jgi:hypothetical protein
MSSKDDLNGNVDQSNFLIMNSIIQFVHLLSLKLLQKLCQAVRVVSGELQRKMSLTHLRKKCLGTSEQTS